MKQIDCVRYGEDPTRTIALVEAEAPCARRPASSRFGRASKLRVGDVVAIPSGGTWRERMAVSDADALVLPAEVDLEQADIADRVLPGA